ncbi:MAG: PKD domain-containing protein [Chloroflexaceae bacterium]
MKSTHLHPIRTSQSLLRVGAFLLIGLLACLALLHPARPVLAAPLAVGDIAVIGVNIDQDGSGYSDFTIVTLADIDGGEVVKITDEGWNGSAFVPFANSEGTITWMIPAGGISAGTVIQFSIRSGSPPDVIMTPSLGSVTVSGWELASIAVPFSGTGDQILIYQNTSDFIYGFTNTNDNSIAAYGNWSDAGSVGTFTQRSELPPGLTNSTGSNVATAHALTGRGFTDQGPLHKDNNVYTGPTTGDKNFLLTEIGKDSNWTGSDATPQNIAPGGTYFSGTNPIFTVSAPNAAPTATGVTISGTPRYGETLTGNYTYNDAEGDAESGTVLAWYRADDAACSVNRTATGATGSSYTLVTADVGKYICFEVTPDAATGTSPGSTAQLMTGAPVESTLVINEIDYDQPGTDAAEFVEIKNTGSTAVNLDSYNLLLVGGPSGPAYVTVNLPNMSLAAGDYYVVCGDAANVPDCDLDSSPDTNFIQNGAPDAVALQVNGTVVEAVSYEGNTIAPYTEGTGTSAADDNVTPGIGLSRLPDGTDTDDNDADFSLRCITPGATNTSANSGCVNAPPTADAGGPYTVAEGSTVALDASDSSDSDGTIATYAWDLDGDGNFGETGAAASRGDETGVNPTFNAAGLAGPASFPIALRVTDDDGATDTDTSVSISITNVAPTADAGGPYTVLEGGTVALAGSGSDPVDALTYTWDLDGDGNFGETGAAAARGDETGQTPTFDAGRLRVSEQPAPEVTRPGKHRPLTPGR